MISTTATSLANGSTQLAVFTDGNSPYTGAITGTGSQTDRLCRAHHGQSGAAQQSIQSDASTARRRRRAAGDTTRSDFLYSQLTTGSFTYSPQTGLGSTASPFSGTHHRLTCSSSSASRANAATTATQLQQGQDVVVSTLQQKFNSVAGVSIDTEMSNLIALQNSYAANAHVMSVVQSMMNTLIQAQL